MAENGKPLSNPETLTLLGLIGAVVYGIYRLFIWAVHVVTGWVIWGWQALKMAVAGAGLMVAGVLAAAFVISVLEALVLWLAAGSRVRRQIGRSSLPRFATYQGQRPTSWLDAWLTGLVAGELERLYGRAAVDEAAFGAFVSRRLPRLVLRPENRARFEARVIGPLYSRLQQGEGALQAWVERYGSRRLRRPFWPFWRALHVLSMQRLGWAAGEVWASPDLERVKSCPRAFGRFVWEAGWTGITAIESILMAELALGEEDEGRGPAGKGAGTQARAGAGGPGTAGRAELRALAAAPGDGREPAAREAPRPRDGDGIDEETGGHALAGEAERVVEGVLALLHRDGAWWELPGEFLDRASEDLLLAAAPHPEPGRVHELRSHVLEMRARLGAFEGWYRAQMEGPYEDWSPTLREALSAAGEPSAEAVRRNALRCFLHAGIGGGEGAAAPGKPAVIEASARERPAEAGPGGGGFQAPARAEPRGREPVLPAGPGTADDLAAGVF